MHGPAISWCMARERDKEVEPPLVEQRIWWQQACTGAQEHGLLRIEQLEAQVVLRHVGHGGKKLDAEGGAI